MGGKFTINLKELH